MRNKKIGLIQKASKASLIASLALMAVSTIALFFYTRALLEEEVDEGLYSTEARVVAQLRLQKKLFSMPPLIEVIEVDDLRPDILKDTMLFDPSEDDIEPFRELSTFKNIGGTNYRITVRSLALDSEDILMAIMASYAIIILLAFLILFYLNKAKNKKLWSPFFDNLAQMKKFSLAAENPIQLVSSDISEFSELNKEVTTLTNRVRNDYKNLKQFTEDVSHEMQTPLAIIQAKIENIINENSINEDHFNQLTSIQKDIKRLTQLNKKLTLLTKIDNKQFVNREKVDITHLIREGILNFKELSSASIERTLENEIVVEMDPHLAGILCNNLLSNAIKHNSNNENITVSAKGKVLSISNYGEEGLARPDQIFTRFYKESNGPKSTGLGLAISKKICDLYGFRISYQFSGARHIFKVIFV